MAGRHARLAPLVISRALATLVASALLLAVGVVAVTVFTGGERPASGGPRPGAKASATGSSVVPPTTTGTPSGTGPGDSATGGAGVSGVPSAGEGAVVVDVAATSGVGTTPPGMPASSTTSTGSPSSGGASQATLPGVVPVAATWPRGWTQRSDTGRARGKAVGLFRRQATGQGCRPVPSKAKPLASRPEPVACR